MENGTIIFIHGNSSSSSVFRDVIEDETIKYTKLAIDLPGHGDNQKSYSGEDFSIPRLCNYLLEIIATIEGDILLVGNSLGGHLAIEIAPEILNLKGLVIFGTPPMKNPLNLEEGFLSIPEFATFLTESPSDEEIKNAVAVCTHEATHRELLLGDFKNSNGAVRSALAKDILESNFRDEYKIFTTLNLPKFIISSQYDPTINPQYLELVKDNCNGNCEIIYFNNSGHYPSIEKPQEFSSAIHQICTQIF
tara:strand:- start:40930 stop:41676 length:747 start_codon:yes stop_codon:yes gene_type:complete